MRFSIRPAQCEDWQAVTRLLYAVGATEPCAPQDMTYHVALCDGKIVGCAGIRCQQDVATVLALAVMPDHRERGIGAHLVRTALTRARTRGCRYAVLETMDYAAYFGRHGFRMLPQALHDDGFAACEPDKLGSAARYAMACELN